MSEEERKQYQSLTKFQKDIVDSLKAMGFTHKHFTTYEISDRTIGSMDVSKFTRLSDLILYVHEDGKNKKMFEIQNALGL